MGEIMSRTVERSDHAAAHPLVKAYTRTRLRQLFEGFDDISICAAPDGCPKLPGRRASNAPPVDARGSSMGWNLIIKARKPRRDAARARTIAAPRVTGGRPRWARSIAPRAFAAGLTDLAANGSNAGAARERLYSDLPGRMLARAPHAHCPLRAATLWRRGRARPLPRLQPARQRPVRAGRPRSSRARRLCADRLVSRSGAPAPFPRGVPHKEWNLFEMRPKNARHQVSLGARALPALGDARPGVPVDRR